MPNNPERPELEKMLECCDVDSSLQSRPLANVIRYALALEQRVLELEADRERLDWLWDNGRIDISDDDGALSPREAIDAARGAKK